MYQPRLPFDKQNPEKVNKFGFGFPHYWSPYLMLCFSALRAQGVKTSYVGSHDQTLTWSEFQSPHVLTKSVCGDTLINYSHRELGGHAPMNVRSPKVVIDALLAPRLGIGLMMEKKWDDGGKMVHRKFHSPDKSQQRKQLLHVRIL
ncbi:hypothetical protein EVAR_60788_1 [Eumeta japonica]|uniref:Uncharacterized protein n=1 Tax=Eumeta variegata TaxID=151549 RepID=A0A4C1ZSP0_EUMVA|nr:hypothetical protein EVAR_60788_1 [Eumeta japonica]